MATPKVELTDTIWPDCIQEDYPDQTALAASIDLIAWKTAEEGDALAHLVAATFINTRGPKSVGWNADMTDAQTEALYDELIQNFTYIGTTVDAITAALVAAKAALP